MLIGENDLAWIELLEPSDGFAIRDNVVHATGPVEAGIRLGTGGAVARATSSPACTRASSCPKVPQPTITGNRLEGLNVGIHVGGAESGVVIEDNRFCDNEQDLAVPDDSSLTLDPSNEVCDTRSE